MQTGGLNTILAWVLFGILLAVLAWLLLRSGRNDALSPVVRPRRGGTAPQAGGPRARGHVPPQSDLPAISEDDQDGSPS